MDQIIYANKHQSQGICIHKLSQLGPCLGKMPLGLNSFCYGQNIMILVLDKLTSRLEEAQNSFSLLKSLCRPHPNLESRTTSST